MSRPVFFAVLLLAVQVLSLPVTSPTAKDDTKFFQKELCPPNPDWNCDIAGKVMKCIIEVISDTVTKPNPLPISQECLEILQGDERILSILRHQNLLKELQEIAIQGATERTEQQKKNSGFEDELSEVLESQSNKNVERDLSEESPDEEPTVSFAEPEAESSQKTSERDVSKDDMRNSLEERETRAQDLGHEDEELKSNEAGKTEDLSWDDAVDNHIHDDIRDDEVSEQRHQEGEEAATVDETVEFEDDKEHISKTSQEESNEEVEDSVRDQAEEEEEEEDAEEEERGTSEEEHPTSSEDEDYQREDDNEGSKGFEKFEKPSEGKEKYHSVKGGKRNSLDKPAEAGDTSHAKDAASDETEEGPSKDLEDAKRWNKMDELAKQLTTTKRAEENESNEDPDRSMKLAVRSHKYDFHNTEDDVRRPQKHHSKEESSEGGFPLVAMPEEKKDEEGSANRRTEDQELESLAAIEAELEKVAHKLHALRTD